jgi:hypothetical protein
MGDDALLDMAVVDLAGLEVVDEDGILALAASAGMDVGASGVDANLVRLLAPELSGMGIEHQPSECTWRVLPAPAKSRWPSAFGNNRGA